MSALRSAGCGQSSAGHAESGEQCVCASRHAWISQTLSLKLELLHSCRENSHHQCRSKFPSNEASASVAAADAAAEAAATVEVLAAVSQAAILLGQLVANPVAEREAIPAAALDPVVIAGEELGCLGVLAVVFQVRSDHAYGKLFVFFLSPNIVAVPLGGYRTARLPGY
jgi:hypothetical protein